MPNAANQYATPPTVVVVFMKTVAEDDLGGFADECKAHVDISHVGILQNRTDIL